MTLAEQDAEERVAAGYRIEAQHFAQEARKQAEKGNTDDAHAALVTSYHLRALASSVERLHRGIEGRND